MASPNDPKGKAPSIQEVLRFLLEHEQLSKTQKHFGLSKAQITDLLSDHLSASLSDTNPPTAAENAPRNPSAHALNAHEKTEHRADHTSKHQAGINTSNSAPNNPENNGNRLLANENTPSAPSSRKTNKPPHTNGATPKSKPKPASLAADVLEEVAPPSSSTTHSNSDPNPASGNDKVSMKKAGKTSTTRKNLAEQHETPESNPPQSTPRTKKTTPPSEDTAASKKITEKPTEKPTATTKKTTETKKSSSTKKSSEPEDNFDDKPAVSEKNKTSKKKASPSSTRTTQASLPFEAEDADADEDEVEEFFEDEVDEEEDSTTRKKKTTKDSEARSKNRRQSSPRGRRATILEPEHYTYQRLLIYTDGAARGNPGESGAGVVLKTPEGEEVGRFGRYLGKKTNNHAEYEAVLLGLHQAREFGASEVTILSDSDLLIRQLLKEYRVRAQHLRDLFDQVQEMLSVFEKHQIKRIGREKNADADLMANRAIDERL